MGGLDKKMELKKKRSIFPSGHPFLSNKNVLLLFFFNRKQQLELDMEQQTGSK